MLVPRTIAQLPRIDNLDADALFEVATHLDDAEKYYSRSVEYGALTAQLSADLQNTLSDEFEARVNKIESDMTALKNGSTEISGIQKFRNLPMCTQTQFNPNSYGGSGNIIPNLAVVRNEIANGPGMVSLSGSVAADGNPLMNGRIRYDSVEPGKKFYFWHIDKGETDSSEATADGASFAMDPYERIRDSGLLVVWGWLKDAGSVKANEAWVAMFARLKTEGSAAEVDLPVQVQPWICGKHSSVMQYVGFTVPVAAGSHITIRTGFKVDDSASAFQNGNTLTFVDGNYPNSFFGYVIKSNGGI